MTIGLFWTIFAGVIAGILVDGFMPMKRLPGIWGMAALCGIGIAGALVASFIGQALHFWGREEIGAFIAAVAGAGVTLGGLWYANNRRTPAQIPG